MIINHTAFTKPPRQTAPGTAPPDAPPQAPAAAVSETVPGASPKAASARLVQENAHTHCLMCGTDNPFSLGLRFHADGPRTVRATFQAHSRLQGYDGIVHGGVIAALLDAAMTHCLFHQGIQAVTGDLRIRFRHAVSCECLLDLRAWVVSETPPLYRVKAELTCEGTVMAWAEAKFMQRHS